VCVEAQGKVHKGKAKVRRRGAATAGSWSRGRGGCGRGRGRGLRLRLSRRRLSSCYSTEFLYNIRVKLLKFDLSSEACLGHNASMTRLLSLICITAEPRVQLRCNWQRPHVRTSHPAAAAALAPAPAYRLNQASIKHNYPTAKFYVATAINDQCRHNTAC